MPLREDLKEHIPIFLWEMINYPEGHTVTAEDFNAKWNLNVTQGDQHAETIRDILQMLYATVLHDTDGATHLKVDLPVFNTDNLKQVLVLIDQRLNANASAAALAISTANSAVATANQANSTANAADAKASAAVATANAADAKADIAIEDSEEALTKANEVFALKPNLEQAVADAQTAAAAVDGKADVTYVNQVAQNFVIGSMPNDSIVESKLAPAVRTKLNEFNNTNAVLGEHLTSQLPHITIDPVTSKLYRYGVAIQDGEWGIKVEEVIE